MKIGIPATSPNLDAKVENRLGTAAYLLVIDLDDLSFESAVRPSSSAGPAAGIEAISLLTRMGAKTILAGYISPNIELTLRKSGIEVITPVRGTVLDALEKYRQGTLSEKSEDSKSDVPIPSHAIPLVMQTFRKTLRQFQNIIPALVGVVLLVGLFRGFMSQDLLLKIFQGKVIQDTLWGACIGSLFSGNPVNSYVVGETLLNTGVSLFGVAALMLTWVNVGLLQLPAEISALGKGFAITRAIASFFYGYCCINRDCDFTWRPHLIKSASHNSQSTAKRKWQWFFSMSVIALYVVMYFIAPDRTVKALMVSGTVLKQLGLPLLLAFMMMVLLNLFINPGQISGFLGGGSGIKGILLSSVAGILSMGPIYAWLPLLSVTRDKGASDFHLANFLNSRAVKPVLLPLMISYFGWRFSLTLTILNMVGALFVAWAVHYVCERPSKTKL